MCYVKYNLALHSNFPAALELCEIKEFYWWLEHIVGFDKISFKLLKIIQIFTIHVNAKEIKGVYLDNYKTILLLFEKSYENYIT